MRMVLARGRPTGNRSLGKGSARQRPLSATGSFRLPEAENRALSERAHHAERSVSNFVRQQLRRRWNRENRTSGCWQAAELADALDSVAASAIRPIVPPVQRILVPHGSIPAVAERVAARLAHQPLPNWYLLDGVLSSALPTTLFRCCTLPAPLVEVQVPERPSVLTRSS